MKDNNKELEQYKGILKGVAIVNIIHALLYTVGAILVMTLDDGEDIAMNTFNITYSEELAITTLTCITCVVMAIPSLILGVLTFKALKPGSKLALLTEIVAFISLVGTVIFQISNEIGFHWTYTLSNLIYTMTIVSADYIRRHNTAA